MMFESINYGLVPLDQLRQLITFASMYRIVLGKSVCKENKNAITIYYFYYNLNTPKGLTISIHPILLLKKINSKKLLKKLQNIILTHRCLVFLVGDNRI